MLNMRGNMELELRKIGKSFGVILPAEVLHALQVKEGDKLTLLPNERGMPSSKRRCSAPGR
jgi:antitoxin component of MazEF toxin-antitoxin module